MTENSQSLQAQIGSYISACDPTIATRLMQIRELVKKELPEVEEIYSYNMPGFRYHGKLLWYAPAKHHVGVYVIPRLLDPFRERLSDYGMTKSAIQIRHEQEIPVDVIRDIVRLAREQAST